MLAAIAVILAIAALKASYPVAMPLVAAVVIIAAVWPVKPWLEQVLPTSLSYVGTILVLAFVFAGFIGTVWFTAAQVVAVFGEDNERFLELYRGAADWASQYGFKPLSGNDVSSRLIGLGRALLGDTYAVVGYLGFIAILVVLGLPEVPALRKRIAEELDTRSRRDVIGAVDQVASKIRDYLGATLATSVLTGAGSVLWAWLLGLDLALVWGVLNFVLNFIPVAGNIIGIVPPSLYALVQFGGWFMPLVVFLGYAVLQIAISNFVYPILQGRSLSLRP